MMLRSLSLILLTAGALAGCGLKGPLYLPKQEGQQAATPGGTSGQKKDRTRDSGSQTPAAPSDMGTPPPSTLPREN